MVNKSITTGERLTGWTTEDDRYVAMDLFKVAGIGPILLKKILHLLMEDSCVGVILGEGRTMGREAEQFSSAISEKRKVLSAMECV